MPTLDFPRYEFPEDERKYDWLSMLLDAFQVTDRAVATGISAEEKKRGKAVACHEGCFNCCLRPTVPLLPIEFAGISWYASEKLTGAVRDTVKRQLQRHLETPQCPFLVEGRCSIYPVRPIVCRTFHIFGEECMRDEDPFRTRRGDMWCPTREIGDKVLEITFPFYGITSKKKQKQALSSDFLEKHTKLMHTIDWKAFHDMGMSLFDKR